MPSSLANSSNTSSELSNHEYVTCSVDYITDASANALASSKFMYVTYDLSGSLTFTHENETTDVVSLNGVNTTKICTIDVSENMRDSDGSISTALHMEILQDMYNSGSTSSTRPTKSDIMSVFTETSVDTFQTILYGAIKHAIEEYIESRFVESVEGGETITPRVKVEKGESVVTYGFVDDANPDHEHSDMFLVNLLNTCDQSDVMDKITSTVSGAPETVPVTTISNNSCMVVGLKVTSTGGFKNEHLYAVGIEFTQ